MDRGTRIREAYEAAGIDHSLVWNSPQIQHEIGRILSAAARATKHEPNMAPDDPYYYLAASDDPDARKILSAYYSIHKPHRRFLPIEAICVKAGVSTTRALEIIQLQIIRFSRIASSAILAATHPAVVEKTIDLALHAEDERIQLNAQSLLHKAAGLTPQPKGAQTIVNVQANAQASAEAQAANAFLPSPEQTIRRLSERLTSMREIAPTDTKSLPDATGDDTTLPDRREFPRVEGAFKHAEDITYAASRAFAPMSSLVPASPSELFEEEEASDD